MCYFDVLYGRRRNERTGRHVCEWVLVSQFGRSLQQTVSTQLCKRDLPQQRHEPSKVKHVTIVQVKLGAVGVRAVQDMLETRVVVARCTALDAVHDIAQREQELDQVAAVLASDASHKGDATLGRRLELVRGGVGDAWGDRPGAGRCSHGDRG